MAIEHIRIIESNNDYFSDEDTPYSIEQFDKVAFHASLAGCYDRLATHVKIGIMLDTGYQLKALLPLNPDRLVTIDEMCIDILNSFDNDPEFDNADTELKNAIQALRDVYVTPTKKAPTKLNS